MEKSRQRASEWIPQDDLRRLRQPRRVIVWIDILATYAILAGGLFLARVGDSAVAWAAAFVLVVIGQQRLAILVHEGAHGLLARSRRTNDLLTNCLIGAPIFMDVNLYRAHHFVHHAHSGTRRDPDFTHGCLPLVKHRLAAVTLATLTGIYPQDMDGWRVAGSCFAGERKAARAAAISAASQAAWGLVILVATSPSTYFFAWCIPLFTVVRIIDRLRFQLEHMPDVGSDVGDMSVLAPVTRTVAGRWLRHLIAPLNFNFHNEHHLCPGVSYTRLAEVHRLLVENGYYDRSDVEGERVDGYWDGLKLLVRRCNRGGPSCHVTAAEELYAMQRGSAVNGTS